MFDLKRASEIATQAPIKVLDQEKQPWLLQHQNHLYC